MVQIALREYFFAHATEPMLSSPVEVHKPSRVSRSTRLQVLTGSEAFSPELGRPPFRAHHRDSPHAALSTRMKARMLFHHPETLEGSDAALVLLL